MNYLTPAAAQFSRGIAPIWIHFIDAKSPAKYKEKVEKLSMQYFGATFGAMAYQVTTFFASTNSAQGATRRWVIVALATLIGAAFSKKAYNKDQEAKKKGNKNEEHFQFCFKVQHAANTAIGLVALYFGQYAYSLPAISAGLFTAMIHHKPMKKS